MWPNVSVERIIPISISDPENGSDTFLRKVGSHTEYTELYLRRWQYS
jgi:hypothetical protein